MDQGPTEAADERFDPEARELCEDGACTGLLGDDRRCKLCGRLAQGSVSVLEPSSSTVELLAATAPPSTGESTELSSNGHLEGDPPEPIDFAERRLCEDGACTGLLDAAGVCKVCGRALSSNPT